MKLSERRLGDVVVIDITGDLLVADNPGAVKESVKAALQRGDRRIVLNVANLRRMDSTCLGEVIASYTSTTTHGGVFKLVEPDAHLRRMLELTRLDTVIDTYETEAEGIASFKAAGSAGVVT
jgi:anti-sigma B factor antagonist